MSIKRSKEGIRYAVFIIVSIALSVILWHNEEFKTIAWRAILFLLLFMFTDIFIEWTNENL